MNFKKIAAALVVSATLAAGLFADNHPYGMDIAMGIVGFDGTKYNVDGVEYSHNVVNIFPLKINTYDCPWLNNHLGIYASVGFFPGVHGNAKIDGNKVKPTDAYADFAVEFMAGPCFGIDLGRSSVRFQVGVPFHVMAGAGYREVKVSGYTQKDSQTFSAWGFAITPQFRFMANRRCSLVVGTDVVFDFAYNRTIESEVNGVKASSAFHSSDALRFAFTPYVGLGINFGN